MGRLVHQLDANFSGLDVKMSKIKIDPLTDWKGFLKEIQNESPRAAVLIAGAFLDAQLRKLLSNFFVDDKKVVDDLLGSENRGGDKPISSFSARIKTAYCLGLISKSVYEDLNTIKSIRNEFAHKLQGYTFDEPEIIKWCKSLKLAKMITDTSPHFPDTHGGLFLLGVTQLSMYLSLNIIEAQRNRRSAPKGPKIDQAVIV